MFHGLVFTNFKTINHESKINYPNAFNAKAKGDKITDTAAAPNFAIEHYYELLEQGATEEELENYESYKYIDPIDCIYTGEGVDCLDDDYEIFPKDTQNVMAYTKEQCAESFTIGQAIKFK